MEDAAERGVVRGHVVVAVKLLRERVAGPWTPPLWPRRSICLARKSFDRLTPWDCKRRCVGLLRTGGILAVGVLSMRRSLNRRGSCRTPADATAHHPVVLRALRCISCHPARQAPQRIPRRPGHLLEIVLKLGKPLVSEDLGQTPVVGLEEHGAQRQHLLAASSTQQTDSATVFGIGLTADVADPLQGGDGLCGCLLADAQPPSQLRCRGAIGADRLKCEPVKRRASPWPLSASLRCSSSISDRNAPSSSSGSSKPARSPEDMPVCSHSKDNRAYYKTTMLSI